MTRSILATGSGRVRRDQPRARLAWGWVAWVVGCAMTPTIAGADGPAWHLAPPTTVAVDVWLTDRHGDVAHDDADGETTTDDWTVVLDDEPVPVAAKPVSASSLPGRYLVFVDDVFCMPAPRNRFLARLRDQLDHLGPADQMALVAYDGEHLTVLTPWTRSVPRLTSGLRQARERPALGPRRLAEQRQLAAIQRSDARPARPSSFSGIGFNGAVANTVPEVGGLRRARTVTEQVADVMQAAAASIDLLGAQAEVTRGVPGRATLLLLAGAWPVASNAMMIDGDRDGFPLVGEPAARQVLAPLMAAADRWGFSVSPVTVPASGTSGRATKRPRRGDLDVRMAATLDQLAIATGGVSLLDGAHAELLTRAMDTARAGYRLTIVPPWRGTDQRPALQVVAGSNRELRTRTGLADPGPRSRFERAAAAAVMLGHPTADAEAFQVEVVDVSRTVARLVLTPIGVSDGALMWTVVDPEVPTGGSLSVEPVSEWDADTAGSSRDGASKTGGLSYRLEVRGRRQGKHVVLAAYDAQSERMWLARVTLSRR